MFDKKNKNAIHATLIDGLCPGEVAHFEAEYDGDRYHILNGENEIASLTIKECMIATIAITQLFGKPMMKSLINFKNEGMNVKKDAVADD